MKDLLFFALLMFNAYYLLGQPIEFETCSWQEVKQKAKQQKKYIFVDAYAEWCGPCKYMDASVFTHELVGEFFNQHYINYKVNAEKGEGIEFAYQYEIIGYPTLLFFNPDGELVHRVLGGKSPEEFLRLGKNALHPQMQIFTLKKRYEAGEKSKSFLQHYIRLLQESGENFLQPAQEYMNMLTQEDWENLANWDIMTSLTSRSDCNFYRYVLIHRDQYAQKLGKERVSDFLQHVLIYDIEDIIKYKDENRLWHAKKIIPIVFPENADEIETQVDMYFYADQPEKGFNAFDKYMTQYCTDAELLNEAAWKYYENSKNRKHLERALYWAEKAVMLKRDWYTTDTKAHLLYKLGRYKEAKKVAQESLALGKADGLDTSSTLELLQLLH
ncbi:MAG: thioredoxin family protein [Cytophagales bacterium]|nr:thioredoxin family protein [Cytophagales bacterium]MDW8384977.1 thioredoxin family protein [Flammeovirgaceae bacterium]